MTVAHRDGFVTQNRHPFGKEFVVNRQVPLRADPLIKYAQIVPIGRALEHLIDGHAVHLVVDGERGMLLHVAAVLLQGSVAVAVILLLGLLQSLFQLEKILSAQNY